MWGKVWPGIRARLQKDRWIAAAVFLTIFVGSLIYGLANHAVMELTHNFFDNAIGPAIGVAKGEGFKLLPNPNPDVKAFLNHQVDSIPWDAVPDDSEYATAGGKFFLDRIYLIYSIGLWWMFFGFSWTNTIGYSALALAICGTLVYGIYRMVMGRALSVALALIVAILPSTLVMLPSLRDLGKGPWILATILYCSYVVFRAVPERRYLLYSTLIGLVIGIGFGFRQDSLICLPAALGIGVVFARLKNGGLQWRRRLAAGALMVGAFFIPASPPIMMTAETGGNNAFYLVQGFAAPSLDSMHLENRSYTPLFSYMDFITHGYLYCYAVDHGVSVLADTDLLWQSLLLKTALRTQLSLVRPEMLYTQPAPLQIWEKDSEILGRHYLQELLTTYPADVVTRWYSSVLTALRGLDPAFYGAGSEAVLRTWRATLEPFYRLMYACAPWLALAGMLLLAARRMWSALALMLVLVYFLGYPSLSFQLRHTYHLSFAFLLLPGVVIDRLARTVIQARSEGHDVRGGMRKAFAGMHGMRKPAVQVAGFIGVVLLIFWLPWKAAGVVQAPHVEDLWARCETADLEAFEAEAVAEGERWKTYTPVALPDLKTSSELPAIIERMFAIRPLRDYVCEYLVLDLEAPDGYFEVGYDYTESWYNMVATHQLPEGQTRVRYFFPVFSVTDEFVPSYEAGVPEFEKFRVSQDVVVHGMYRVRDRSQFPFLMNIWHTSAPEDFSGWSLDL